MATNQNQHKQGDRVRTSTRAGGSGANRSTVRTKVQETSAKPPQKPQKAPQKKAPPPPRRRGPSENANSVLPVVLGIVGGILLLLYIIAWIGNLNDVEDAAGQVGALIRNTTRWVLGYACYALPAMLFVMAFRWRRISAKGHTHTVLWVQFSVILLVTATTVELLAGMSKLDWKNLGDAIAIFDADKGVLPGGAIGGVFAILMRFAFRPLLSSIILIATDLAMIVFFIGLTPEVILSFSKRKWAEWKIVREERRLEAEEARIEEEAEAERERKAAAEAEKEEQRRQKILERAEALKRKEDERRRREEERLEKEREEERIRAEQEAAERAAAEAEAAEPAVSEEEPPVEEPDELPFDVDEPVAPPPQEQMAVREDRDDELDRAVLDADENPSDRDLPKESYYPLATDLDFDIEECPAVRGIPKSVLPGDEELLGFARTPSTERVNPVPVSDESEPIMEEEALPEAEGEAALDPEESPKEPEYVFPTYDLLAENTTNTDITRFAGEIEAKKQELSEVLTSFGVRFRKIEFSRGPTITRYEIQPEPGQRVKAIQNLMDDIALSMAVSGVRFEPSIPGKTAVGIEVPNTSRETVFLRGLVESEAFQGEKSRLTSCLGADIAGAPVVFDISKMPHLLVAGATGMGKSVCINSIIVSLLYKAKPEEVKLVLIDPKKVEFAIYRDMPHLQTPIISDPQKAAGALCSAVSEMEKRFELIERVGARDIAGYKKITAGDPDMPKMWHIVIIIDELADLMMTASDDVEKAICRLAQKARAAGIHLVIGTQRPSVDVITGTIKANIPSRIAFTVASQTDSRTILDAQGAEKLCGKGDMLFAPVGASKPKRVQGAFVSEEEVIRIVNFLIRNNGPAQYDAQFMENINIEAERCANSKKASVDDAMLAGFDEDPKLGEAVELAIECGKISTSLMQRRLEIGYGRAAKIIDRMEELGYVSSADGNKPRKILVTMEEYRARCASAEAEGNGEE